MKIKKLLLAAATTALISTASFQASAETAANLITKAPYKGLYTVLKPNVPRYCRHKLTEL